MIVLNRTWFNTLGVASQSQTWWQNWQAQSHLRYVCVTEMDWDGSAECCSHLRNN